MLDIILNTQNDAIEIFKNALKFVYKTFRSNTLNKYNVFFIEILFDGLEDSKISTQKT